MSRSHWASRWYARWSGGDPCWTSSPAGSLWRGVIRGGAPRSTWRATDLDWEAGTGPLVAGPAAAIGLTLAGRDAMLDQLEGPGVAGVRTWLQA